MKTLNIIFDQFSRYQACADIMVKAGVRSEDSILDVGSGPETLFKEFMPENEICFVDPLIRADGSNLKITGNVFSSELDGKKFDCVSAVDVLEHVPVDERKNFIERVSELSKNFIVLAFPTSDSSSAVEVDTAVENCFNDVYGESYSWLEEHHRYGLPSLKDTAELLESKGWYCQSVGHGHAPWLKELLCYVVSVWEIYELKDLVKEISYEFNEKLYRFDFAEPCYRQFLIASRNRISKIDVIFENEGKQEADKVFSELMLKAHEKYFYRSLRLIRDDGLIPSTKIALRDERDAIQKERDEIFNRLEEKAEEVIQIKNSLSWRLTMPLRFAGRIYRYGLIKEDKQRISRGVRKIYHALPLPGSVRKILRYVYHRVVKRTFRILKRIIYRAPVFRPPILKVPLAQSGVMDYIVFGVIDWHFRFQRPQQLAKNLAENGHRVFYVSPCQKDEHYSGFDAEPVDDNGRIFQISLYSHGASNIYNNVPGLQSIEQLRTGLGELLDWADCGQVIALVQHPYWYDIAKVIPDSRLVYDCMDYHGGFNNTSETVLQLEQELLVNADLTVVTSKWLDSEVSKYAQRRALICNAAEYEHFSVAPENVYRSSRFKKIIGYYGAIAEWFDQDLVEAVARKYSDFEIVLVGADSVNARGRLGKISNVTFTGEIAYSQLPEYLYAFDVCLIPFKIIPLTMATNPVKVYEYLSAGKPVVAVDLPEMAQFSDLVYVAKDKNEFLEHIDAAICSEEDKDLIERRKSFASKQTWAHRAEALAHVSESIDDEPMVSVVVVTYNNLDLTKECLKSIDLNSNYRNLEIIVVDNASSDGSPEFLREWAGQGANRKLVLNDDNRGFAAANNQGLAIGSGEYLVMLNNDTYVTAGWVRGLVRHLQRDKTIGLIGPVTNNIGNEAKIDINYNNMTEMQKASASYTRRHLGQVYPLRTAAFFCVMMSRDVYEKVGSLDEAFGRGFFEDDDYCRRIEQIGLRIGCAEDVFVHHHLSASFNKMKQQERQKLFEENLKIYEKKWGEWVPHGYRASNKDAISPSIDPHVFEGQSWISGKCNVCGHVTQFYYTEESLWRESLNCGHCRTTSRYRSIARGLLRAISEISGVNADSLAGLQKKNSLKMQVYDTQPPFYYEQCAYPLPDLLANTEWISVYLSQFKPKKPAGAMLSDRISNQNLEALTFDDASFDVVITSDVMEHVRLDDRAHREIYRILKNGGVYIFTVPHDRSWKDTLTRVRITDPDDPVKDEHILEPEYHGDTNSDDGTGVLAYRTYGKDLEEYLSQLGFSVEYSRVDMPEHGIMNTELYYCRKKLP